MSALAAVALAAVLDRTIGEFPGPAHPVTLFGRIVAVFDREWIAPRVAGAVLALALPLGAAAVAAGLVSLAGRVHLVTQVAVAGLVLFSATSLRMLLSMAHEVTDLTGTDLAAARERLPALAGRDPEELRAGQVRSAVAESAAENLADGLVAPLLAFAVGALGGLPLAAAAAVWVKAVNTMDSMLGYRHEPHGGASARLDDLVMYIPARASALLVALAARDPDALGAARRWAQKPPSPNSGWPMATLAAVLKVRLEKPGTYALNPVGTLPGVDDTRRGVRLIGRAGLLAYAIAGALALLVPEVPA